MYHMSNESAEKKLQHESKSRKKLLLFRKKGTGDTKGIMFHTNQNSLLKKTSNYKTK